MKIPHIDRSGTTRTREKEENDICQNSRQIRTNGLRSPGVPIEDRPPRRPHGTTTTRCRTEREKQMNRCRTSTGNDRCIYCGVKIYRERRMCENCAEKLRILRKLRSIVFHIKQLADQEAAHGKK